jgi:hypothetical protein
VGRSGDRRALALRLPAGIVLLEFVRFGVLDIRKNA